jgi:hypothetical protein
MVAYGFTFPYEPRISVAAESLINREEANIKENGKRKLTLFNV